MYGWHAPQRRLGSRLAQQSAGLIGAPRCARRFRPFAWLPSSAFPLINQSTPLLYAWWNERRLASDEQGIRAMRVIMQGLTDAGFERLYGTEELCLAAWVRGRQSAGMPCPRCGNPKSYVYDRRVGCTRCDMRWSITSGTVMADTKLPL